MKLLGDLYCAVFLGIDIISSTHYSTGFHKTLDAFVNVKWRL